MPSRLDCFSCEMQSKIKLQCILRFFSYFPGCLPFITTLDVSNYCYLDAPPPPLYCFSFKSTLTPSLSAVRVLGYPQKSLHRTHDNLLSKQREALTQGHRHQTSG